MSQVKYTRLETEDNNPSWPHENDSTTARLLNVVDDEDMVEGPDVELRTRRPEPRRIYSDNPNPFVDFIDWPIHPGDTLSSISLKSGCPIFQLKRANNLITDQDFYARKTLRIPVKRFGILTETFANGVDTGNRQPQGYFLDEDLSRTIDQTADTEVKQFMENVDKDLEHLKEKVTQAPPPPSVSPITVDTASSKRMSFCDGADGGLSIYQALCLVLLVCICLPVIYILVVEEGQHNHLNPEMTLQDAIHETVHTD